MQKKGFTLIELMVTLAIVGLIFATVYGLVITTIDAQKKIEDTYITSEIGPAIISIIRQDLESVFIPDYNKEYFKGQNIAGIYKDADRIDFLTSSIIFTRETELTEPGFSTPNEVGYLVSQNQDEPGYYTLYRREDPHIDDEPLKGGKLLTLYHKIKSFDVKYYDGKEWRDEWSTSKEKKLPRAVRITIVLALASKSAQEEEKTYSTTVVFN